MIRQVRLDLQGIPQHIVQRGNHHQACFAAAVDYRQYPQELRQAALQHGRTAHFFVLIPHHMHLLVTLSSADAISCMMQASGGRCAGHFNARYRRTGTLREGRFKAALIDPERYLMACYRYIELNPVRAAMTHTPVDYP